jgi:hypothetical protein
MKWITRSHVRVDRVACPRLVSPLVGLLRQVLRAGESRVLCLCTFRGADLAERSVAVAGLRAMLAKQKPAAALETAAVGSLQCSKTAVG